MGVCAIKEHTIIRPPAGHRLCSSSLSGNVILDSQFHTGIHNFYEFKRVLGHGQYGTVREAVKKSADTYIPVAIKSLPKAKLKGDLHSLRRELEILSLVDHPNIIKLYETYEDAKYLHLVMEYCTGGDLFEFLMAKGSLSESEVAAIMQKLLIAVNHLHGLSICHRDLKPENCLFSTTDEGAELKLIDFGMSTRFYTSLQELTTVVGTPYYLAPEVLKGHYSKECDIWSLGVVMFVLLSGHQPFRGSNLKDIFRKIIRCDYDFSRSEWSLISPHAKTLISDMLTVKPSLRITVEVALKHEWFSVCGRSSTSFIPMRVLNCLKQYKAPSVLQQQAMKVVLQHLSSEDIADLNAAFLQLDREKTGFITADDLATAMRQAGFELASEDIHSETHAGILERIDYLDLGKIKYSDFLVATLDRRKYLDEEMLYLAFSHFDHDQDGFISVSDLKQVLHRLNSELSDEEVRGIIDEFDRNSDRMIDFEEFQHMMQSLNATLSATRSVSRRGTKQRTLNLIAEPYS